MGARFWSTEECRYFVHVILPQSRYKTGENDGVGKDWDELAPIMQAEMERRGIARRQYTATVLFQHWYQKVSPRAQNRGESDAKNSALQAGVQPSSVTVASSSSDPKGKDRENTTAKKRKQPQADGDDEDDEDFIPVRRPASKKRQSSSSKPASKNSTSDLFVEPKTSHAESNKPQAESSTQASGDNGRVYGIVEIEEEVRETPTSKRTSLPSSARRQPNEDEDDDDEYENYIDFAKTRGKRASLAPGRKTQPPRKSTGKNKAVQFADEVKEPVNEMTALQNRWNGLKRRGNLFLKFHPKPTEDVEDDDMDFDDHDNNGYVPVHNGKGSRRHQESRVMESEAEGTHVLPRFDRTNPFRRQPVSTKGKEPVRPKTHPLYYDNEADSNKPPSVPSDISHSKKGKEPVINIESDDDEDMPWNRNRAAPLVDPKKNDSTWDDSILASRKATVNKTALGPVSLQPFRDMRKERDAFNAALAERDHEERSGRPQYGEKDPSRAYAIPKRSRQKLYDPMSTPYLPGDPRVDDEDVFSTPPSRLAPPPRYGQFLTPGPLNRHENNPPPRFRTDQPRFPDSWAPDGQRVPRNFDEGRQNAWSATNYDERQEARYQIHGEHISKINDGNRTSQQSSTPQDAAAAKALTELASFPPTLNDTTTSVRCSDVPSDSISMPE
ncbi:hypothetical protein G7Y89_g6300 [Cudoniella acicularis]|uniref:Uncharacterized protein n=1 Tax=Cudoniella acicularis TaxID=354080 RepID=A0A8H4W4W8_9HELO|nr:hypothetical protein G7Y89_g6300 [Cudoniella acicularis]